MTIRNEFYITNGFNVSEGPFSRSLSAGESSEFL